MTAVLNPKGGKFVLGKTDGEEQGWHLFGKGFAGALGNADRHRVQDDRSDIKRYAIDVLGAGGLLLTQLRHEHGNRLRI